MKVICKKDCYNFKNGEKYQINGMYSIFIPKRHQIDVKCFKDKYDFISLEINSTIVRFRLNESIDYIDNYIGLNEFYFYDYFYILKEERKLKLKKLFNLK